MLHTDALYTLAMVLDKVSLTAEHGLRHGIWSLFRMWKHRAAKVKAQYMCVDEKPLFWRHHCPGLHDEPGGLLSRCSVRPCAAFLEKPGGKVMPRCN